MWEPVSVADHEIAHLLFHAVLQVRTPRGTGSACAVGDHIVTAAHVAPDLKEVVTVFGGKRGRRFNAMVVGIAPDWDLAILEQWDDEPEDLQPLPVGGGGYIGEPIWHAGFPGDLNVPVIRRGHVSQVLTHPDMLALVDRSMIASDIVKPAPSALLVDMPTFPGASGGPVVDEGGKLIAMVSRAPVYRTGQDEEVRLPMGLALSIRLAHGLVQSGLTEHFPDLRPGSPPIESQPPGSSSDSEAD